MDLGLFRKAVTELAGLRAVGKFLYRSLSWFTFIEEHRRAAQLKNELSSAEVLAARIKLADDVFKILKDAGFGASEIRSVMRSLVVERVLLHCLNDRRTQFRVVAFRRKAKELTHEKRRGEDRRQR
jgi:hypothetical protein